MFETCRCLCCERCILLVCSSVFLVLSDCGGGMGVNVMLLRIYVSRPPPNLWVRSVLHGV